jgi:hypothetical protein
MIYANEMEFLRRNAQTSSERELLGTLEQPNPAPPEYPQYVGGAGLFMGNRPRGSSKDNRVPLPNGGAPVTAYNDNSLWSHFLPWYVIWPGVNHKSTNTRVIINYIKYALYNDTYQSNDASGWTVATYTGEHGYKHLPYVVPSASGNSVNYSYDGVSETVRYHFTANKNPIHGWKSGRVALTNPEYLRCVYVEIEAELGLINGAGDDDRSLSEYMINCAADFYPHASDSFTAIPMIGSSRFIRVGNTARKVNFATVSPPFAEWHRNSDYPGRVSMTEEEFILTNPTFLPTS